MSKGSGAVGRAGRTRPEDGPELPPGKHKRSRPRGGNPGGLGIMGISQKAQPRKDLKWYDGDERAVKTSERIYAPKQGENVETYNDALSRIDKVHAVKAKQSPMQIRAETRPGSGVFGSHQRNQFIETTPGPDAGKVRDFSNIVLNTGYNQKSEPHKRMTLYHEIGHGHDTQQNYEEKIIPQTHVDEGYHRRHYDSENAFQRITISGGSLEFDPKDTPTVQWAKSVQSSKSFKGLVEKRERAKKTGDREAVRYLEYLTDPKELYARSYAQYVAKNADPEGLKTLSQTYKERDADFKKTVGYDQWRGKDFDPIEKSFDRLFGSRGLDTKNTAWDPRVPIES